MRDTHHGRNMLKGINTSCIPIPRAANANEINVNAQHGLTQMDKDEFKRNLVDLYHAVGGSCRDVGPVRYTF
jgi:hypothetical protein